MSRAASIPTEVTAAMGGREPTSQQWDAIAIALEPYAIVAGAGSGKTSVMAARVVYLALVALGRLEAEHPGVLPGNVLCLTFTNKATEHLASQVRRALATLDLPPGEEPVVLNYHSFAAQVIDRHGLRAGVEPGMRILTTAQREELAGRVLDRITFERISPEWQPTVVGNILNLADQAANHLVAPEEIVRFDEERLKVLRKAKSQKVARVAEERIELARAIGVYQELKEELGVYDFGDQIRIALEIVERFPEVIEDYRTRFETVLLDEYQDTNVAQARLLERVFGDGFPMTAVGDPDQNIYAWRGASLFNLLRFTEQFRRSDGQASRQLPLYTNFRSGRRILLAADRILEPLPAAQRPDPDKKLDPWEANGEGEVEVIRHGDEWTEACWVADRIVALHEGGHRWADVAVLCRKSRLFTPLQEAFAERGIPVEIVGLAGLLKVPEVQEVLAYARAVANPRASVSLARILLGPRYRVGYKDLAAVAGWARDKNYELREELDEAEDAGYLLAEALEHLDEVADRLSVEGRSRLEEFRTELAELRVESRRPVAEFLAEIVRRTGMLSELDANLEIEVAQATKRNLAAFLDEVEAFTPLEGELTLRGFLDHADTLERAERQEWSPVQPSEEDSVKVMTVHQAKGLEFDTVFVPGLAQGLLPDTTIQQNPAERAYSLDFELRGDADVLPAFDGTLTTFRADLRRQEEYEERRTCYVALTRARKRLLVSGANWYGDAMKPKRASEFLDQLADWGEEEGFAVVDRGPEIAEDEENPLLSYRERFVRDWPGPALRPEADELFPQGWRRAALDAFVGQSSLFDGTGIARAPGYEALSAERRAAAAHLLERESAGREAPRPSPTVSVSNLRTYAECPRRFYWTAVRPLPRFSGPAARIGTEVHRWIELRARGQATLLEEERLPDLTDEDLAGVPGKVEQLRKAFESSRFAGVQPLFAERAFFLPIDGWVINGRIDAIYGTQDGPWEVVDYKTGRRPDADDELVRLQLDVYALACIDVWGKRPDELKLVYLYLASGDEAAYEVDDPDAVRGRVRDWLRGVDDGSFDPVPGEQCRWCDFLPFCEAGRAFVGEE